MHQINECASATSPYTYSLLPRVLLFSYSIHLENLLRDSVVNLNLHSSRGDLSKACGGRTVEVNVFITHLSQKLSLTTCFFSLSRGSDFHAILSGLQTNVGSIFTLRWPSIKLSQHPDAFGRAQLTESPACRPVVESMRAAPCAN